MATEEEKKMGVGVGVLKKKEVLRNRRVVTKPMAGSANFWVKEGVSQNSVWSLKENGGFVKNKEFRKTDFFLSWNRGGFWGGLAEPKGVSRKNQVGSALNADNADSDLFNCN